MMLAKSIWHVVKFKEREEYNLITDIKPNHKSAY